MIVALYILIAMVVVGVVLYIQHRRDLAREQSADADETSAETPPTATAADDSECCGMHITCEEDSLLSSVSSEVEYYDDEELDRFRGRAASDYSDDEIEEFRSVLLTLLPHDIAGWGRSIQLRGIELPSAVRDELLLIVSEARMKLVIH